MAPVGRKAPEHRSGGAVLRQRQVRPGAVRTDKGHCRRDDKL